MIPRSAKPTKPTRANSQKIAEFERQQYEQKMQAFDAEQARQTAERDQHEARDQAAWDRFFAAQKAAGVPVGLSDAQSAEFSRLTDPEGRALSTPDALRIMSRSIRCARRIHGADLAKLTQPPARKPVIIEGVMRAGEVADFVSAAKIGKSHIMLQMLLAVASGQAWLGQPVKQGRCLLIDNELHEEELKFRLWTVAKAMGCLPALKNIEARPLRGQLRDMNEIRDVVCEIAEGQQFALIGIDSLYRTLPAGVDENSNSNMAAIMNVVDSIAGETKAGIPLVHHAAKGDQSSKAVMDVGAGGGVGRAVDAHCIWRPVQDATDAYAMEVRNRSFPPFTPRVVRAEWPLFVPADDLDPSRLKLPESSEAMRKSRNDAADLPRILAALKTPQKLWGLRKATGGISEARIAKLLQPAVDAGQVILNPAGVYSLAR